MFGNEPPKSPDAFDRKPVARTAQEFFAVFAHDCLLPSLRAAKRPHSRGTMPELCDSLSPMRGRRECRVPASTRGLVCKMHLGMRTRAYRYSRGTRHSLRDGLTAYAALLCPQNLPELRTGGSDQPPVAGSEPVRAQRPLSLSGSEGQIRCLPQPEQLHGLRARTEQGREWMMAQNEVVVVGIDVAKDKVDACIRSVSQRQTFPSTAEGRRALIRWLRKHKVGKAAMEASGGYERDWARRCARPASKLVVDRSGCAASPNRLGGSRRTIRSMRR